MSDAPAPRAPAPEESYMVHFFGPLTVPIDAHHSTVVSYGDQLEITPERRRLTLDRLGRSFLDLLEDEDAQVARWGRVMVSRGPWPADLPFLEPGSLEASEARESARKAAWKLEGTERQAALRDLNRNYGPPTTTSRTTMEVSARGV